MQPADDAPELVVLCDPSGRPVGTAAKAAVHTADTPLHLAFSCYVFDDDGRLLVTRRAYGKRTFGGVRTNTCCGHPAPGESMAGAVRRRLRAELGLDGADVTLLLPEFRYRAVAADGTVEHELCPVYRARVTSDAPVPDPDEVAACWWEPWSHFAGDADPADPRSPWAAEQAAALDALGPDPWRWPAADPSRLPLAARLV